MLPFIDSLGWPWPATYWPCACVAWTSCCTRVDPVVAISYLMLTCPTLSTFCLYWRKGYAFIHIYYTFVLRKSLFEYLTCLSVSNVVCCCWCVVAGLSCRLLARCGAACVSLLLYNGGSAITGCLVPVCAGWSDLKLAFDWTTTALSDWIRRCRQCSYWTVSTIFWLNGVDFSWLVLWLDDF